VATSLIAHEKHHAVRDHTRFFPGLAFRIARTLHHFYKWRLHRGESKPERPERRSGKRIIAGTAFRLEFLVGWYYDADATMAVPELY